MILRETPVRNFIPQRSVYLNAILASRKQIVTQRRSSYAKRKAQAAVRVSAGANTQIFLFLHRHSLRIGCTCGAQKKRSPFPGFSRSVSGGIRTRDLQSRSLTRYPAALQTQSTLLLYSVLCRRARLSFSPADCAYAPQVSRIYPRRRAVPRPLSPGSRGRCEGAVPLPCGL